MANLLDTVLSVLPGSQKAAIRALIAAKSAVGELTSLRSKQEESNTIYNRVKAKLTQVLLSPRYAESGEKIDSDSHNQNMEEIFLDLNSLYSSIFDIYNRTKDQVISLDNDYLKSRASVEKLLNDVRVYSLRKQNPQFNEVKLIDFNSSTNKTKKVPSATVSPNVRLLQLKPFSATRTHLTTRTTRDTKVYTKTISPGLKGELSASFPPSNMVDQRPETFWGTIILADGPISQLYSKNTNTGSEFQTAVEGPVVEASFVFSHTEKINTIRVLPFSEYPVTIVDVSYKPSSSSQVYLPIKDFEAQSTLDWVELNFSPVLAAEVRITIAQENYKKVSYLLPKSVVTNTDIFQRILRERASRVIGNAVFDSDLSLYLLNTISTFESAIDSLEKLYSAFDVDLGVQTNIDFYDDINKLIEMVYQDVSPEVAEGITSRSLSTEVNQQPGDPTVNITKYEYLLGIREVEINYELYYPRCYYESEKYLPQATVSELQIEVDEIHTAIKTPWQEDYRKTSTEWEVEIGGGRSLPIHPINIVDEVDGIPCAKDEQIDFDLNTQVGFTRLGGYYAVPYRLKKNGDLVLPTDYQSQRITGSIPKIEITLTGESVFDVNSIYTIDYAVDPSSYNLNILDKFNSEEVVSAEVFTEVGSNNDIELSKFPFINYEVINLTGFFQKESNSRWNFVPPQEDIFSGQLVIEPRILDSVGNVTQAGATAGNLATGIWGEQSGNTPPVLDGNADLDLSYFGNIQGVEFGYFLKVMDSTIYAELEQFDSATGFTLKAPIEVTAAQIQRWDSLSPGDVFDGTLTGTVTGQLTADYTIGIGVKTDGQIYALTDVNYTPLRVVVAGKDAKNITDYETLVHPAFSIGSRNDNDVEYIQAGKRLYFNQDLTGKEIRVYYNWLTEYLKIAGVLKFNGPVNPNLTPKVNQIRVFSNNLVI